MKEKREDVHDEVNDLIPEENGSELEPSEFFEGTPVGYRLVDRNDQQNDLEYQWKGPSGALFVVDTENIAP